MVNEGIMEGKEWLTGKERLSGYEGMLASSSEIKIELGYSIGITNKRHV